MPGHYGNPSKAAEMMGHKRKKKSKAMAQSLPNKAEMRKKTLLLLANKRKK